MKPRFLESTPSYSTFYATNSKCVPSAVWLSIWKRRLFASPKAEVIVLYCKPLDSMPIISPVQWLKAIQWLCHQKLPNCHSSDGNAGKPALPSIPIESWINSAIGNTSKVCVCVSGVWYHKITASCFGNVHSHQFHVRNCTVLGASFELVTLKGNVIICYTHEQLRLDNITMPTAM